MSTVSRQRLARVMRLLNKREAESIIVAIMLNAVDGVFVEIWGHLGDMGMSYNEFLKLKHRAIRRL